MERRTDEWTDEWTDGMYGWNGKATMTTMPDDDDNEYDEMLSSLPVSYTHLTLPTNREV